MPTLSELTTRIREALGVDDSYEAAIIPFGIERTAKRLLRDYHFPWSVSKQTYTGLAAGKQDYTLPVGFKKELAVFFYDTEDKTYGDPLGKKDGFTLLGSDGVPRHYWVWNGNLSTDIVLDADNASTTNLILWYESLDWAANQTWMLDRFDDMLFTYCVFRMATEFSKPELAQLYGQIWTDDRTSLAVYLNELEFDNTENYLREARSFPTERYPRS